MFKAQGRKVKVVHCPTMVGGNPQGLSRAERELGLDSKSICLSSTYLDYPADEIVYKVSAPLIENEVRRWICIVRILMSYDVIHYNFGETLAPTILMNKTGKYAGWKVWLYNNAYARWVDMIDLKIARFIGKVVTVTYQGDDARQGDFCRREYPIHFCHYVDKNYYTDASDRYKRRKIATFDRYAHFIYAVNPDLLKVLPPRSKFIPYASVDPRDWMLPNRTWIDRAKPLHIVHAPSNRKVKGSDFVIDALNRLEAEGIPFHFTLVEGVSNKEAREIYESADILVDQLLAGFYGGLAVELMALGCPVISYLREDDLRLLPDPMRREIPIINATPDTIYDVLKSFLTVRRGDLSVIGARGRNYVEKWHDPRLIAQGMYDDALSVLSAEG
ncbi:glycosyltransferase family 1 protein [Micavibrio aeruginosavorus]|uniref:glycosyltransferase family 1 protein n=1 Tax=Micavibrio aeruginosavorus TaxID=349221 RepID=UPI003F4ADE9E